MQRELVLTFLFINLLNYGMVGFRAKIASWNFFWFVDDATETDSELRRRILFRHSFLIFLICFATFSSAVLTVLP